MPSVALTVKQVAACAAVLALTLAACSSRDTTAGRKAESGVVVLSGAGRSAAVCTTAPHPYKPYIKELRSPAGVNVLLDSPSDHKHHHGLMFAVSADGVDFWGEDDPAKVGREVVEAQERHHGKAFDELAQRLAWQKPDGGVALVESRRMRLWKEADCTLLSWQSALSAAGKEPVELSGAHYVGLGLRPLPAFNGTPHFLYSEGQPGPIVRGDERLTPGRWCAMIGSVDGKPMTVTMMAHPKNPMTPTRFFTMSTPFAYIAATLGLHQQRLRVEPGSPLRLRYGVAVWDAPMAAPGIEDMYQTWLAKEATR